MTNNFIFQPQFNFSIATLDKLNNEMKDCNHSLKSHNVLDYLTNLEIFYKSAKPFLKKDQINEANNKWDYIKKFSIEVGEDYYEYDSKLPTLLIDFDFFLTDCLHKNGISYSNKEANKGLDYQYKKYGINNELKGIRDTTQSPP